MTTDTGRGRRTSPWLSCLPVFLFSLYPLTLVLSTNFGVVPLDERIVLRASAAGLAGAALLLWALRWVQRDLATRGIWLGWFMGLCAFYAPGVTLLSLTGAHLEPGRRGFALLYLLTSAFVVTIAVRPWRPIARDPVGLNIIAVVLLVTGNVPGLFSTIAGHTSAWRAPAEAMIKAASRPATTAGDDRPDIYYIVLDGFGRADVLRERYGLDLTPFTDALAARGFYVPSSSRANYAQTFLALAGALNLDYLDSIAAAMGTDARDLRPLQFLISHNGLMASARQAGYKVIGIGSDYAATREFTNADVCFCRQAGLDEIERTALELTPLVALPLDRWAATAHRANVADAFTAIEESSNSPERKLVFAHLLLPHPPFVFAANGTLPSSLRSASFNDGSDFRGTREEYVHGYAEQVRFTVGRLLRLIDWILSRPGPSPVIVMHGDHGPGSALHANDVAATDLHERMSIFAAYRFPGRAQTLYSTVTPIAGARALAVAYLGAKLDPLPDRTLFSTWKRPFEFISVPEVTPPSSRSDARGPATHPHDR